MYHRGRLADLARALGDTDNLFGPSMTCKSQTGTIAEDAYDRRCLRIDLEGLCYPGTGERDTAIFVRIRRNRYHVVGTRSVGIYESCASVA